MPIYETWHFSALVELGSEEQDPVTFFINDTLCIF